MKNILLSPHKFKTQNVTAYSAALYIIKNEV